jgi:hypothetical protein
MIAIREEFLLPQKVCIYTLRTKSLASIYGLEEDGHLLIHGNLLNNLTFSQNFCII